MEEDEGFVDVLGWVSWVYEGLVVRYGVEVLLVLPLLHMCLGVSKALMVLDRSEKIDQPLWKQRKGKHGRPKRKFKRLTPQQEKEESYARALWQLIPLLVLALSPLQGLGREKKSSIVHSIEDQLRFRWKTANGGYFLKNRTYVFENGTRIYYNGTISFPNGTLVHQQQLHYSDLGECRSYLEESAFKEAFCGIRTTDITKPWEEKVFDDQGKIWEAPLLFPRDDSELASMVRNISDNGCVIRPVGGSLSVGGLVVHEREKYAIGISLAEYESIENPGWRLNEENIRKTLESSSRVRAEAGRTLLDVYALIRPLGYFFPTNPSFPITVGGAVSTNTYGTRFGAGPLNSYVTRLRVMYANGTVEEISGKTELSMWRGSMGLLGFVLAAEFKVEHRPHFSMGYRSQVLTEWDKWSLDDAMASLLPGAHGAEYFFDGWSDELMGVGYTLTRIRRTRGRGKKAPEKDKHCGWDFFRMRCKDPEFCEFRFKWGDFLPSHSCRLIRDTDRAKKTKTFYQALQSSRYVKHLRKHGLPHPRDGLVEKALHGVARGTLESVANMIHLTRNHSLLAHMKRKVERNKDTTNDGLWMLESEIGPWMSYYFPLDVMFEAIDEYRQFLRELVDRGKDFTLMDAPLSIQLVRIDNKQVLSPKNAYTGELYAALTVRANARPRPTPPPHNVALGQGGLVSGVWKLTGSVLSSIIPTSPPAPVLSHNELVSGKPIGFQHAKTAETGMSQPAIDWETDTTTSSIFSITSAPSSATPTTSIGGVATIAAKATASAATAVVKKGISLIYDDDPVPEWVKIFAELEHRWLTRVDHRDKAFPHLGGAFGFAVPGKLTKVVPSISSQLDSIQKELAEYKTNSDYHKEQDEKEEKAKRANYVVERYEYDNYEYEDPFVLQSIAEDVKIEDENPKKNPFIYARQTLLSPNSKVELPDRLQRLRKREKLLRKRLEQFGDDVETRNYLRPFTNTSILNELFTLDQRQAFMHYRSTQDPNNHFWGGRATRLFKHEKHRSGTILDSPAPVALLPSLLCLIISVIAFLSSSSSS